MKEKIGEEVTLVAQCGPDAVMNIDHCSVGQHSRCEQAWKEAWWLYVGWKILNPDPRKACPLREARHLAEGIQVSAVRMSAGCLQASKAHVAQLPEDVFLTVDR